MHLLLRSLPIKVLSPKIKNSPIELCFKYWATRSIDSKIIATEKQIRFFKVNFCYKTGGITPKNKFKKLKKAVKPANGLLEKITPKKENN